MPGTKGPGEFYPGGEGAAGTVNAPAPPTTASGAKVVRQHIDPRQLTVNIQAASGQIFRWGPDESDASRVPTAIGITTQLPGGFATFDCTLARRPDLEYHDLDRFAPVTVTGGGGALVAFDGYLSTRPQDRSTTYSFTPEAIGWSGIMKDDSSFTEVYIDRQLSKWATPSLSREALLLRDNIGINFWSVQAIGDPSGSPALTWRATGPFPSSVIERTETWYDAGPNANVAQFRMPSLSAYTSSATSPFPDDSRNQFVIATSTSDPGAEPLSTTVELLPAGSPPATPVVGVVTNMTPGRYGVLYAGHLAGLYGGSGDTYGWNAENLAVVGDHGLSIQSVPVAQGGSGLSPGPDDGFYGGDIAADIITRTCSPQLTIARGPAGIVNDHTPITGADSFIIPNFVFNAPVDADTAIQQLNQFYLYDYGVYERRQFFWRPPATGTRWHARLTEGVQLQDQGPQIETAINGVIVTWSDPSGVNRFVGPPPGAWDRDPATGATSSPLLQDTNPANPCNVYNRKRWPVLQMQGMSTWGAAVRVGAIYMQQMLQRKEAGSLRVTGFITDDNGNEWPVWMVRSGDSVIIDDYGTGDAGDLSHYIIQTSYDHNTLVNTLTLDAPPNRTDWILQRLNLAIAALG